MTPDRYHDKCTECPLRAALARVSSAQNDAARDRQIWAAQRAPALT
jgi:hypothetical protein